MLKEAVGVECRECGSERRRYELTLIKASHSFIKFVPQIKEKCDRCGLYQKFAKQTDELIEAINEDLKK